MGRDENVGERSSGLPYKASNSAGCMVTAKGRSYVLILGIDGYRLMRDAGMGSSGNIGHLPKDVEWGKKHRRELTGAKA